jgi:hypothetical protein
MDQQDTDIKTVRALKANGKASAEHTITLSTGVVLRGKTVPPLGYVTVAAAFPTPKPPMWKDPNLGRLVENPDNEDYINRVKSIQMESSSALLNVMIVYGTEVVSTPPGFSKPKDKKWLDRFRLTGLPIFDDEDWKYLTWIKFEAATTPEDLNLIKEVVGKLSGVPEKDVEAAESFPGSN